MTSFDSQLEGEGRPGPEVLIVGTGLADFDTLTIEAHEALEGADIVIGARRLLGLVPVTSHADQFEAIAPADIAALVREHADARRICVVMSGDTGFYSGTTKLYPLLSRMGMRVRVIPGISSIQALSARLGRPWQGWRLVSAHGRDVQVVPLVRDNRETFFLTGGQWPVGALCDALTVAGYGELEACVGERLGQAAERVEMGTVAEMATKGFSDLAVLLVTNPHPRTATSGGLPDEAFVRGKAPMTKSEVRAVILSKMQLHSDDVVYDVGAGTGSVSIEAALQASDGEVWSIEVDEAACELIEKNSAKFGTSNLHVIHGGAPEALEGLPAPTVAFIGGSKGNLRAIMETLLAANPSCRIVASAITLETIAEMTSAFAELPLVGMEAVTVSVARSKALGSYHLLMGQNPIVVMSATGCADASDSTRM